MARTLSSAQPERSSGRKPQTARFPHAHRQQRCCRREIQGNKGETVEEHQKAHVRSLNLQSGGHVLSKKSKWLNSSRLWKLAFTAILFCGSLAHNSEASPTVQCDDPQMRITSTRRGFGVDCTAAQSDLESDTAAEANSTCQSLGFDIMCPFSSSSVVIITKACAWNENHLAYRVVGYREFKCAYVIEP